MGRADGGENPFTVGSANDTGTKVDIVFTVGSYAGPAVKPAITAGWSAKRCPVGNGPTVICVTTGYPKTVGESPGGE
jgi:hypothetical protein